MLIDKLSAEVTTACAKLTPLVQNALAGKVLRAQREVDDALRAVMPAQMTAVELAIVQLVSLAAFRAIAFKYPRGFGPSLLIAAKAGPKDAVVLPKLIFPMIAGNARLRMRDLSLVVDPRSAAISSMKDAAKLVVGISRAFGVTLNAKLPGMVVTGESRPPTAGNALAKGGKDAKKSGATAVSGDSVCTLADSGMYVMAGTVGVKLSQLIDWLLEAVSKSGAPAGAFGLAVRFNGNAMATVAEETGQPMIELHTGERLSTEEFAAELQRLISVYPTIQLMDSPVSKKV